MVSPHVGLYADFVSLKAWSCIALADALFASNPYVMTSRGHYAMFYLRSSITTVCCTHFYCSLSGKYPNEVRAIAAARFQAFVIFDSSGPHYKSPGPRLHTKYSMASARLQLMQSFLRRCTLRQDHGRNNRNRHAIAHNASLTLPIALHVAQSRIEFATHPIHAQNRDRLYRQSFRGDAS